MACAEPKCRVSKRLAAKKTTVTRGSNFLEVGDVFVMIAEDVDEEHKDGDYQAENKYVVVLEFDELDEDNDGACVQEKRAVRGKTSGRRRRKKRKKRSLAPKKTVWERDDGWQYKVKHLDLKASIFKGALVYGHGGYADDDMVERRVCNIADYEGKKYAKKKLIQAIARDAGRRDLVKLAKERRERILADDLRERNDDYLALGQMAIAFRRMPAALTRIAARTGMALPKPIALHWFGAKNLAEALKRIDWNVTVFGPASKFPGALKEATPTLEQVHERYGDLVHKKIDAHETMTFANNFKITWKPKSSTLMIRAECYQRGSDWRVNNRV